MRQRTTVLAGFVLVALSAAAQNIVGYEYWIDTNHVSRVTVDVAAPFPTINATITPNYANLSIGDHDLHLRLKQEVSAGETHWSSVVSRRFWNYAGGPWEIIAVRYWTDASLAPSDMQYMYFDTPQTDLDYQSFLEACALETNNNSLFLQLLDNHGQWSVVTVKPLNVVPVTVPPTPTDITVGNDLCIGDTVTFTGTPGNVVPPAAIPTDFECELLSGSDWVLLSSDSLTAQLIVGTDTAQLRFRGLNACSFGAWYLEPFSPVPIPAQPSAIVGDLSVCEGDTLSYEVTPVTGVYFEWLVTGGWVDSAAGLTFTPIAGPSDGFLTVTPINVCGQSGLSQMATIEVTTAPVQPVIFGDLDFCQGDTSMLSITPVPGESYSWDPSGDTTHFTHVWADGPVSVVASTGGGCTGAVATAIVDVPDLVLDTIYGPGSVLIGDSDTVSVLFLVDADEYVWGPLPYGLAWGADPDTTDEVAILNIADTLNILTISDTLILCVYVLGGDGCIGDTVCIELGINGSVATNTIALDNTPIVLVPNPTSGSTSLYGVASIDLRNVIVTDALGQQVTVPPLRSTDGFAFDFTGVAPGVYFVVISSEHLTETRRLVVQR